MYKVAIIGSREVLADTISALHDLKLLHIADYKGGEYFDIGRPFEEAPKLSEKVLRARALINFFGLKGKPGPVTDPDPDARLAGIDGRVTAASDRLKAIDVELAEIASIKTVLGPIEALKVDFCTLGRYESLAVFKGFVARDPSLELRKLTGKLKLFSGNYSGRQVIALFIDSREAKQAQEILAKHGYSEIAIPQERKFASAAEACAKEAALLKEKRKIEGELRKVKGDDGEFLLAYEDVLSIKIQKAEAPLHFATSRNAFIAEGWVPMDKYARFEKEVASRTGGRVQIERSAKPAMDAPVMLKNPKLADPFEFFLYLYSLPKYSEIDPTFVVALTFPFFFGFMLGDIGYGLLMLGLFMVLRLKFRGRRMMGALVNAMIVAAVSSVLFGFVFGEFFGATVITPLLHRAEDVNTMLLVSVLVGVVHLNLGFLFGFLNVMRYHGAKAAVLEKGSWVILEIGAALIAADSLKIAAVGVYPGAAVILVAIAMLYKAHGVGGIIELPAIFSNMLSYARLFAVGLASVSLALVINRFATEFFASGGVFIVLGVLTLVFGHVVNLGLGILGCFLHSMRLHYVEFFSKFYEGGGEPYSPFG